MLSRKFDGRWKGFKSTKRKKVDYNRDTSEEREIGKEIVSVILEKNSNYVLNSERYIYSK